MQIWLIEQLDMISKPTIRSYGPSSFLSRAVIKIECQTESDEVKFINKKSIPQFNGIVISGGAHPLY